MKMIIYLVQEINLYGQTRILDPAYRKLQDAENRITAELLNAQALNENSRIEGRMLRDGFGNLITVYVIIRRAVKQTG